MKDSGAHISVCKRYRYGLWRQWSDAPMIMFIGLNPSKADAFKNDNTITKVMKIARHNGYGGVYMVNLFSFITPHPKELIADDNEYKNIELISEYSKKAKGGVVFCWGNFKQARERSKDIIGMFPEALCIKQNNGGSPKHPLYCRDDSRLRPFVK